MTGSTAGLARPDGYTVSTSSMGAAGEWNILPSSTRITFLPFFNSSYAICRPAIPPPAIKTSVSASCVSLG